MGIKTPSWVPEKIQGLEGLKVKQVAVGDYHVIVVAGNIELEWVFFNECYSGSKEFMNTSLAYAQKHRLMTDTIIFCTEWPKNWPLGGNVK